MADDDDKKGSRDNTGRDAKPKSAQNTENAPTGSLGTNRLTLQGLNLGGGSKRSQATKKFEQSATTGERSKDAVRAQDAGEKFPETSDTDVNNFYGQSQQMIPKESPLHPENSNKAVAEQKPQGPRISQSDFAKAFRAARDQTHDMNQSKGRNLE